MNQGQPALPGQKNQANRNHPSLLEPEELLHPSPYPTSLSAVIHICVARRRRRHRRECTSPLEFRTPRRRPHRHAHGLADRRGLISLGPRPLRALRRHALRRRPMATDDAPLAKDSDFIRGWSMFLEMPFGAIGRHSQPEAMRLSPQPPASSQAHHHHLRHSCALIF